MKAMALHRLWIPASSPNRAIRLMFWSALGMFFVFDIFLYAVLLGNTNVFRERVGQIDFGISSAEIDLITSGLAALTVSLGVASFIAHAIQTIRNPNFPPHEYSD